MTIFLLILLVPFIAECALIPEIDNKILGGYNAAPGQFPFQASIQTADLLHDCGGSIVSSSYILSSAHCARDKVPGETTVLVGSHLVSVGGVRYGLAKIVSHPQHDAKQFQNDLSLMKTDSLITFTDLIQPIKIAITPVEADVDAIASGWGTLAYPGAYAINLQYLPLTIIDNESCRNLHTTTNAGRLFPGVMCAQPVRGTGMCVGDTGSPLVMPHESTTTGYVQIGVVSWGVPCGANYPDVYTRLSSFITWIAQESDAFIIERDQEAI